MNGLEKKVNDINEKLKAFEKQLTVLFKQFERFLENKDESNLNYF